MESESLKSMLVCTKQSQNQGQKQQEKKPRPADQEALKCPRCDSTNTKFCYYNNYGLSQPRYFCKSCRRYWTQGGTLRNVPVGGGCRKNPRTTSSTSSRRATTDHHQFITATTTLSLSDFSASYGNNNIAPLGMNPSGTCNSQIALLGNSLLLDGVGAHNPFRLGAGGLQNAENGRVNSVNVGSHDMGMQFEHNHDIISATPSVSSSPTRLVKHEVLRENRLPWGLPRQFNGSDQGNHMNVVGDNQSDFVRESWISTGVGGSSWHNLLNSPLI